MEPPTSSYPQCKFSSSRNSWPFTKGVIEEFRAPHSFPKWRKGKQKEILFVFWGTDCYHITKASSWKDSSQGAPCLENGLDCLSFPGRLTPSGIHLGWKWVILTAGLPAIIRCWSVWHTSFSVGSSCHSPEHGTRAGAAAFSCGVRWTLPWKPRKQKTPPTRVARCWVAEVVFYFFWASLLKDTKFRVCKTSLNENKTSPITKMQTCWKGKCSSIQVSENMRAKVLERIS